MGRTMEGSRGQRPLGTAQPLTAFLLVKGRHSGSRSTTDERPGVEFEPERMLGGQARARLHDRFLDVVLVIEAVEPQRQRIRRLVLDQEIPPDAGGSLELHLQHTVHGGVARRHDLTDQKYP